MTIAIMIAIGLSACSEKEGEDTSVAPVVRLTCDDSGIVESAPGELIVAVVYLESQYPELGPCCDPWEMTWTARLVGDEKLYLSEVELVVDETTPRLRAVFPGDVETCELVIWRE